MLKSDEKTFINLLTNQGFIPININEKKKIPHSFKVLNKKIIEITFSNEDNIPKQVNQLKNLKKIIFLHYKREIIPKFIEDCKNISEIELNRTNIKRFDFSVKNLKHLKKMKLHDNQNLDYPSDLWVQTLETIEIGSYDLNTLNIIFPKNSKIKNLTLSNTNLKLVPLSLFNLIHLEVLNLSINNLKEIPREIYLLKNLKEINFEKNKLITIPDNIISLQKLKKLIINQNSLIKLPSFSKKQKKLRVFEAKFNQFKIFPKQLNCFPYLRKIDLTNNKIELLIPFKLKDLTTLKLGENRIQNLPLSVFDNKQLRYLSLDCNLIKTIPDSIIKLSNLEELSILINPIELVSSEILKLKKIKKIVISKSSFQIWNFLNPNLQHILQVLDTSDVEEIYKR